MADAQDISDIIVENAQLPQFAQNDMGSMRQHPLQDQIAADRYRKSVAQAKSTSRGFLLTQLRPPGAV
jgi:hypothetical protein